MSASKGIKEEELEALNKLFNSGNAPQIGDFLTDISRQEIQDKIRQTQNSEAFKHLKKHHGK